MTMSAGPYAKRLSKEFSEALDASMEVGKPTTDLIKRAERLDPILEVEFDTVLDFERNPHGAWMAKEEALLLIRDLIAALQAAPTAEDLRGWAVHAEDGSYPDALADDMRAAAARMEGK